MSISFTDPELERRLTAIGEAQDVKAKKNTVAKSILEYATRDMRGIPSKAVFKRAREFARHLTSPRVAVAKANGCASAGA